MYSFYDKKHNKTTALDHSVIVNHSRTLASGATIPLQQSDDGLNEINEILGGSRDPQRNDYLGLTLTRPTDDSFIVGTAWADNGDKGQHDEDLILFKETSKDTFEVERLEQLQVRNYFPAWDGYHHGDKSYLKLDQDC